MNNFTVIVSLLLLAGPVQALNVLEDYEDDTIGANPSNPNYSFAENNCDAATKVVGDGFQSDQSLSVVGSSCTAENQYGFGDLCESSALWSQDFRINALTTNVAIFQIMDAPFPAAAEGLAVVINNGGSSVSLLWFNNPGTVAATPNSLDNVIQQDVWYQLTVSITTCSGNALFCATFYNIDSVGDPIQITECHDNTTVNSFSGLSNWRLNGMTNGDIQLDNLCFGLACVEGQEEMAGPSEFDSGLIAFAASAGFISQESQLFFALVLIGLATVTTSASSKWVAPGRFKNYLLMSVQTLIAVFCVIAAFLDLWMFLVAFMLALFAVRGGSEVRNTFHQIREALQRQNDRAGEDIGPTQVMEVQVSEREEAVERAFQRLEDQSPATDTVQAPEGPAEAVSDDRGGDA